MGTSVHHAVMKMRAVPFFFGSLTLLLGFACSQESPSGESDASDDDRSDAPDSDEGEREGSGGMAGDGDFNPGAGGAVLPFPASGGGAGLPEGSGGSAPVDCGVPSYSDVPLGYGKNTTGGGSSTPIVVSSFEEATAALEAYRADFKEGARSSLVLHYDGTFNFSSITDVCAQHLKEPQLLEVKEMDNVTILGLSGSSGNFGVRINRAKNVIVRNMTLGLLPGGDYADAIMIEGNGTSGDVENVWIDHNDLFSSTKDDCDGAGDTEFDGLIDVKSGARYITISYNYLHEHQKTTLVGFSDNDLTDRYVTYHHNWFENLASRTPLLRYGYVHVVNNYFNQISSSGINVRNDGVALIEANFFEYVHNPVTSRYSDLAGYWDLRDNTVGEGVTWSESSDTLANAEDWQSTVAFPEGELTYSFVADPSACVKQIVQATAGALL